MASNYNPRDQLPFYENSKSDIRMSTWQYHDFIDSLVDSKLTAEGLMKFKRMYQVNSLTLLAIPTVTFPLAFFAQKWLVGPVNRGIASSRLNFFGMAIFYPLFLYYGFTRPIPRKLYTDVLTDSGPDGSYVRQSIRMNKPGLWRKISLQLNQLRFSFPEMLEQQKQLHFPSDFVNSRIR